MNSAKLPSNGQWVVITVNSPLVFNRTEDESWVFNPNRRYVVNASIIPMIHQFVASVTELANTSFHRPLNATRNLNKAKILVERHRDRGIGDLLFMTGPLAYLQHLAGGEAEIDFYALSDRGSVLTHNPSISNGTTLFGPIEYDILTHYSHHWFVDSVTENDEEPDQQNVYDALFRQIGLDPENVEPVWKRPFATLSQQDHLDLARFYRSVLEHRRLDLSRIGYYVVAPFSNATLRSMDYGTWLKIINELASRRPVVVVGYSGHRLPSLDMSAGTFIEYVSKMGGGVINAIDTTPLRMLMALIQRAVAVVCLDSGPLYVAQALNTPAVSLWGTHDPGLRLGYDKRYMDTAIWNSSACPAAPCCAYANFPVKKCPDGDRQVSCSVLASVEPVQVVEKLNQIESRK